MNCCDYDCNQGRLPAKTNDLTGMRFGRLVVIAQSERKTKGRHKTWKCQCDCGQVVESPTTYALRNGQAKSCGCLQRQKAKANGDRLRTHGQTGTTTHNIWLGMIQRCHNPTSKDFCRYGAKGIFVCDRWRTFENFLADMGERPDGKSIDRIDNSKGYSPENCRWASPIEQARNKTVNKLLSYKGKTQCLTEWAIEVGINHITLQDRIAKGWSVERALTQPVAKMYSHQKNRKKSIGGNA